MPRRLPVRLLLDRCTIQRRTRTPTGQGGHTEALPAVASDVPCRRQPVSQSEVDVAAHLEARLTHTFYFDPDQEVRRDDRLMLADLFYDVRDVTTPSIPVYLKALVEEGQAGT